MNNVQTIQNKIENKGHSVIFPWKTEEFYLRVKAWEASDEARVTLKYTPDKKFKNFRSGLWPWDGGQISF